MWIHFFKPSSAKAGGVIARLAEDTLVELAQWQENTEMAFPSAALRIRYADATARRTRLSPLDLSEKPRTWE